MEYPATTATICCTRTLAEGLHLQYAKWKRKSSLLVLIGCVASIIVLSYAVLLSAPSSVLFLSPQISTFFGIPHDDENEIANPSPSPSPSPNPNPNQAPHTRANGPLPPTTPSQQYEMGITEVFERAAMPNKTVIITTLNAEWAKEGTMIDMFLESFRNGDATRELLQHLVIVCVDDKAYQRCIVSHPHCFYIKTHGVDLSGENLLNTADFLKLMWRRIEFLKIVLEMNYNFIFTDTDVLWFRNPFPHLQSDTKADFQIACDRYIGRSRDVRNNANTGFIYVRANARTVRFYDYWYKERKRGYKMNDQEVFNAIKFDKNFTSIGMKLRFLDTQFFGGFCGIKTTDMTQAITMHATCCIGLKAKLTDLRMMLDGWKKWQAQNLTMTTTNKQNVVVTSHNESVGQLAPLSSQDVQKAKLNPHFKVPWACQKSWKNTSLFHQ